MSTHWPPQLQHTDLFLVRVWLEEAKEVPGNADVIVDGIAGAKTEWCGRVQRVVDGESHQFSSWQGLVDAMLTMLSHNGGR